MFPRSVTSAFSRYKRPIRRSRAPALRNRAAATIQRMTRGYLTRRRLGVRRLPSILRRMALTRPRPPFRTSTSRRR